MVEANPDVFDVVAPIGQRKPQSFCDSTREIAHVWKIETPQGAMSLGVCQKCGEEREFKNSVNDHFVPSSADLSFPPDLKIGRVSVHELRN